MKNKALAAISPKEQPENLYNIEGIDICSLKEMGDGIEYSIINLTVKDKLRTEEMYHEKFLKQELKKHNIDFEVQTISPYGMRTKEKETNHIYKLIKKVLK